MIQPEKRMEQGRLAGAVRAENERQRANRNGLNGWAIGLEIGDSDRFESHGVSLWKNEGKRFAASLRVEPDFAFGLVFFGGGIGGDELLDGVEDEMELLVVLGVFLLEGFDFLGEQGV